MNSCWLWSATDYRWLHWRYSFKLEPHKQEWPVWVQVCHWTMGRVEVRREVLCICLLLFNFNFKLAKLCYLVTSFQQPGYLAHLISPYSQSRSLRSSTKKLLSVPPHNLDTAARRFSVAAPRLWNSLPLNCRTAPSVITYKTRLKTFLFASA